MFPSANVLAADGTAVDHEGEVLDMLVQSRPGLGSAFMSAISTRDYPTLQGIVLLVAVKMSVIRLDATTVAAILGCTAATASARKIRSVDRETRWR